MDHAYSPDDKVFPQKRALQTLFNIFVLFAVLITCILVLLSGGNQTLPSGFYTKALDVLFIGALFFGFVFLRYPPEQSGLNFNRLRLNLLFGFCFGAAGLAVAMTGRYYLIQSGSEIFKLNLSGLSFAYFLLYPITATVQEVVVKGVFQNYFNTVLENNGKNKFLAVIFSSLIFAQFHLVFGIFIALCAFLFGIVTGMFYQKTRSVVGISIAHFLIGSGFVQFASF